MNLRRLNHILIPQTPGWAARLEQGALGRVLGPVRWLVEGATPEGRALLVTALIVGTAGIDVHFSYLYLVFCLLAGLLVTGLLLRPLARLPGVRLTVEHPPRVTVEAPVVFTLTVHNAGPRRRTALRLAGPFLPWDGQWEGPRPVIPLLGAGETARVTLTARFLERGQRQLGRFSVASVAPFGLFFGERRHSPEVSLAVVPRVATVADPALPAAVAYQPGGVLGSTLTGESLELLGVREYRRGDRARDLHARSWAKTGQPMVREYRQELFRRVAVILASESPRGTSDAFEAALELTAGLLARLARADCLVDLLVLGPRPLELTLGCHVRLVEEALDLLAAVKPAPDGREPGPTPPLGPRLGRQSGVLFVTTSFSPLQQGRVAEVRQLGLPVRLYLVGVRPPPGTIVLPPEWVQELTPAAVRQGPALHPPPRHPPPRHPAPVGATGARP